MEDKTVLGIKKMKSTLIYISLILIIVFTSTPSHAFWWMVYHKPAFKGKVIDAETKEPIEGAVVVITYSKTSIGIVESYSVIINVRETLTDKNGEFYIPSYTTVIQPLSSESMANFIIFKPGYGSFKPAYGSFPEYQKTPTGITPIDEEIFFSEGVGTEGELELWVKGEKGPDFKKFKVTFGIVELPKLKTREERERRILGFPTDFGLKELPLLYKAYEEEKTIFDRGYKK